MNKFTTLLFTIGTVLATLAAFVLLLTMIAYYVYVFMNILGL